MDQDTRERHTARCYSLWAAATNYRRYAADMATADKAKAAALNLTGELLLIAVIVLAGLAGYYLLLDWNQWPAVVLAILTSYAANNVAGPVLSQMFVPVPSANEQEKETV
ncbi:hypothetical protein [Streptomyces sp. NPDC058295]|uniref:hypothetical protein n=1 Tax=Streptomyces sp. NPDC058295 TaxID=3346431 RepID=UPI0036EF1ADF